ncbi:MAG: 50S ribosomal protein L11 methyltransferase [Chloroflexi bacterium]|nr:50S ribosomal protein L11 methyltransferase [Chloroflexota bacterium]
MRWLELSTRAEAEAVEAIAELFQRYGQGVAIEEPVVAHPDETYQVDDTQLVTITTYLPLDDSAAGRRAQLEQGLHWLGRLRPIAPLQVREIVEADWENAWKRHFHVRHVGRRLVIVPSWRQHTPRPDEVVLHLDPGMAFGTGVHPTTRLCLLLLERWLAPGSAVLDLGTGSGILAIAAAKLGAARVVARDIDTTAVRVAAENVARNAVSDRVAVAQGDLASVPCAERFALALANINLRVLREVLPDLAERLAPGGAAILSGVLREYEPALRAAVEAAGLQWRERRRQQDWLAAVVVRP